MADATRRDGDDASEPLPEPADDGDIEDLVTARLVELYRDELRTMAERSMAGERIGHTLQPTALLSEAVVRVLKSEATGRQRPWDSRRHFFGAMANAMRQVLVDHARRAKRKKRGGRRPDRLPEGFDVAAPSPEDEVLAIDEVLQKLERVDPRGAMLVKLRFFLGLTHAETARELGVSESTVKRDFESLKKQIAVELRRQRD